MTGPLREWVATGDQQLIDPGTLIDRTPAYDPRTGEHLWVVSTAYRVVPEQWRDRTHTPMLDRENLLIVAGPGCYYCEREYTPRLASRRCKGEPR